MDAFKCVRQNHAATQEVLELLEDFRSMVNDCIRVGLEEGITSMKELSLLCYHRLDAWDLPTCYRLTAISKAAGILSNYRKSLKKNPETRRPYAKRRVLTDCYGFKMFGRLLRLQYRKGEYLFIVLNDHTTRTLAGHGPRSVTLTPESLSINYSKTVVEIEPRGAMGIDRNLGNITIALSDGTIQRSDLSKATRIKQAYREVKSHFRRNDARVRKTIYGKYGRLQRNRIDGLLHWGSSLIVKEAKQRQFAIVVEDLKGIRKLYKRGNGQGTSYRARLNSWSYRELQRQIVYKARWEGIPVIHVSPLGTSSKCSVCGSRVIPEESRIVRCPRCGMRVDRDENAAKNILAKGGVRFAPEGPPGEAMVTEPRREEAIRAVDGGKVA